MAADAAGDQVVEVIDQMPFDGNEAVQDPKINPLEPMKPISLLLG